MHVRLVGRGDPVDPAIADAHFITLHVPLTDATRGLFDAERLRRCRPDAILVNTSRGPVVDEEALATALHDGRLGGAGLDVYELEPRVHPDLIEAPNVVLLPHWGGTTESVRREMSIVTARGIIDVLGGEAIS